MASDTDRKTSRTLFGASYGRFAHPKKDCREFRITAVIGLFGG
jgi:hypothetical protein